MHAQDEEQGVEPETTEPVDGLSADTGSSPKIGIVTVDELSREELASMRLGPGQDYILCRTEIGVMWVPLDVEYTEEARKLAEEFVSIQVQSTVRHFYFVEDLLEKGEYARFDSHDVALEFQEEFAPDSVIERRGSKLYILDVTDYREAEKDQEEENARMNELLASLRELGYSAPSPIFAPPPPGYFDDRDP